MIGNDAVGDRICSRIRTTRTGSMARGNRELHQRVFAYSFGARIRLAPSKHAVGRRGHQRTLVVGLRHEKTARIVGALTSGGRRRRLSALAAAHIFYISQKE
jgi:hypothetical protein